MSREVKFRGLTQEGKWVYGDLLHDGDVGIAGIRSWNDFNIVCDYVYHVIKTGTNCQYTGLKDKNEAEIYEGHIVETNSPAHISPTIQEVIFVNGAFQLKLGDHGLPLCTVIDGGTIEVIGNIYQDKHLLE